MIAGGRQTPLALASSYDIFFYHSASPVNLWGLLTSPALFLLAVLIKLLLIFMTVVIVAGLFKPSRIAEFSAKLFGMELNYKYAKDVVDEAEQSQGQAQRQLDMIGALNEAVFTRLAWPFEESLAKAKDKADAIRQIVLDVLRDAYDAYGDLVNIQVIPFNTGAVDGLGGRLAAIIRLSDDEDEDVIVTTHHGAGIAIFHGELGFGSVIVLEGLKGYSVSSAEICAAGSLYAAAISAAGTSQA